MSDTVIGTWHISVLIPARNEAQLLPRCLHSVLHARAQLPASVSCDIVVAVDSSTDDTWAIANRMVAQARCGIVVRVDTGRVGTARALAADAALMHRLAHHGRWWLANTDADCEVPADWLRRQWRLALTGVQAVAGVVDVDAFVDHHACVEQRFLATYRIEKDGTHSHVHGANLGVRADAYLRAGGWGALATGEDHDLWQRLIRCGARTCSTDRLRVLTSGRRVGRAPAGFADALAAHNESAA